MPLPVRVGYGWLKRKLVPHPVWDSEEFKRHYRWLQETEWWSREQLEALQLHQLRALVTHAYQNVPYYRRVFSERRLTLEDITSLADLQKLPLLTKEDVQDNREGLIAQNIDRDRLQYVTTGGTTGSPLGLYHNKETAVPREASFRFRQWDWAGYGFGDRIVTLRGDLITRFDRRRRRAWWDYNTGENELVLSSFDMSEENMHNYVGKIREFEPRFISAYPSSLEILARFMRRNAVGAINAAATFCESETLYPWQRELIEAQFGCKILAGCGFTERVADAVECERHEGYDDSMQYGVLELVGKDNEPITKASTVGRVVASGLDTYCMPLIRYATDDLALYSSVQCSCKRESVLIEAFKGRTREFIISKTGKLIPLTSWYSAAHMPVLGKIRELKFIQEWEGELIVQMAKDPSSSKEEIAQEFRRDLFGRLDDKEFSERIMFVDRVSRAGRGKQRLLEQRLPIEFEDFDETSTEMVETATER